MRRSKKDEKYPENGFEEWGGYMNAKKAKLADQFNAGASKETHFQASSNIFNGISVYVNGYTVPSADEIKMAMMVNGGQYHHYYSISKTKYIIASNLAEAKLKKIKGQPKVVKPEWISACLSAKKLLDFRPYLLYSNQSKTQPKIQFPQLAEFESPIKSAKFKTLQIKINDQKITSTPKAPRTKIEEQPCEETAEKSETSFDLSGDLFDDTFTFAISQQKTEFTINEDSTESRSLTPSSDVFTSDGGQRSAEPVELPDSQNSDFDMFDCTLVAEELDAAEKEAEQSRAESRGDQSILELGVTSEEARLLIEGEPSIPDKAFSEEDTALVEDVVITEQKRPVEKEKEKASSPQKGAMKGAGEQNFLSEFYSNSRLHHISTMGSTFKQYVTELRKNHTGLFLGREKLLQWKKESGIEGSWSGEKIIMHIDMDCFFVSVGLRSYPELRGQPVGVTHAKGNPPSGSKVGTNREAEFELYKQRMENKAGVETKTKSKDFDAALDKRLSWRADSTERSSMAEIASCNYEAREAGLKNGMFLGQALKLCPNLKMIPYDFEGYKEVSYSLYNTVASFTLDIEAVSCDEMFVDCTELLRETNTPPLDFATFIRSEIKKITNCPASTGFGSNILQARLATKKAKPDGQFHLSKNKVDEVMKEMKIADLPGVGRNMAFKMQSLGLQTCADLQKMTLPRVQASFGQKIGSSLFKHCRGDDDRSLEFEHVRKSVSAEVNYGIRFKTHDECRQFMNELAQEVQQRLEAINRKGRCITLKLMIRAKDAPEETAKFMGHGVCDSFSKSISLLSETSDSSIIVRESMQLLGQMGFDFTQIRGIGVQMTKLSEKSRDGGGINQFLVKGKQSPLVSLPAKQVASTSAPKKSEAVQKIDESVLAELPEDIRQEILREYKINHIPPAPVAGPSSRDQPSTSATTFAAELSFSQIDPSFLEALPDDLKMEIVADLKSSKTRKGSEKILLSGASPKKVTPTKRKRGRPVGSKNNSFKVRPKIKVILSPVKRNEVPATEILVESEVDAAEEPIEDNDVLSVNAPIDEVLPLIKEWFQSGSDPTDVDTDIMIDYLSRLVKVKKVDKVEILLRTIKLYASRKVNESWMSAYVHLLDTVQPLIVETFGCQLKVV